MQTRPHAEPSEAWKYNLSLHLFSHRTRPLSQHARHRSRQQELKEIITMKNCNLVSIVPFNQLETKGSQMNNSIELIEPEPETIAMIMYTSGSTGDPKGVILTHLNVTSSLMACCPRACNLMGHERHPEESYLGYLPLAHIFELTQEFIVLFNGCKIGYSSPYTLTDSRYALISLFVCDHF